jgi:hypothetical protein
MRFLNWLKKYGAIFTAMMSVWTAGIIEFVNVNYQ